MPIRPEYRWLYPIDWPQLSAVIRFRRAGGRCESCGRPHGRIVFALPDGRWWDGIDRNWRSGRGKLLRATPAEGRAADASQADASDFGDRASRSRPDEQPTAQSRGVLPKVPSPSRPGGASAKKAADPAAAQGAGRPLFGGLSIVLASNFCIGHAPPEIRRRLPRRDRAPEPRSALASICRFWFVPDERTEAMTPGRRQAMRVGCMTPAPIPIQCLFCAHGE